MKYSIVVPEWSYCKSDKSVTSFVPGGSSQGSSKSATIEMYVGSSYNQTTSGDTLSSLSEKSDMENCHRQDFVVSIFLKFFMSMLIFNKYFWWQWENSIRQISSSNKLKP